MSTKPRRQPHESKSWTRPQRHPYGQSLNPTNTSPSGPSSPLHSSARLSSDPYVEIDRLRHRVAELEQVIRILKNRPDPRLQLQLAPSQPQPSQGPLLTTKQPAESGASNSNIFGANGMKNERGTDFVSPGVARGGVPARDGSMVVKLQDSETMRSRPAEDRKGTKLIHESGPDSGAQMDVA